MNCRTAPTIKGARIHPDDALAKELEFKALAVMACDKVALPLRSRIESVADEAELEDVYDTERQILYVGATRACDRVLVSGVKPGSEFLLGAGVVDVLDRKIEHVFVALRIAGQMNAGSRL